MGITAMSTCYIIGAAPLTDLSHVVVDEKVDNVVICADGGIDAAKKLGITPDFLIGDFDSALSKSTDTNTHTLRFSHEKDDTDMMLCIKHGLQKGYTNFVIYGALGGRLDHTIANIQSLSYIAENGGNAMLKDDNTTVFLVSDSITLKNENQEKVSIFSSSECCEGVTLKGFKYPLDNVVVKNSFPIGISNEFADDFATISVKNGQLLVIIMNHAE